MSYNSWIGQTVVKKSRKPFKSGKKKATVKGVTINPNCDKLAFEFFEDDSVVNCEICRISTVKE